MSTKVEFHSFIKNEKGKCTGQKHLEFNYKKTVKTQRKRKIYLFMTDL